MSDVNGWEPKTSNSKYKNYYLLLSKSEPTHKTN